MIATENMPELEVHAGLEPELRVERTDIVFEDLAEDIVRIAVTVRNEGGGASKPTLMKLESAPLGAFVPWKPLGTLTVPALEPGESRELSLEVRRPRPVPLGDFDRVPPAKLLTAVNSPEESPTPPGQGFRTIFNLLGKGQPAARTPRVAPGRTVPLAPDLSDLLGRRNPYWAGNINVFIGSQPVERHRANALRVYPGCTNLAMFVVGMPHKGDAYAFELRGSASDWKAALYNMTSHRSLWLKGSEKSIHETQWVESEHGLMVMLATEPPADCQTGEIEVRVTRRSDQTTAIVEFSLDPDAKGPGCYVA